MITLIYCDCKKPTYADKISRSIPEKSGGLRGPKGISFDHSPPYRKSLLDFSIPFLKTHGK
jgi:hypothetical protein